MLFEVLISLAAILAARVLWMRWRYDLHKIPSPPGLPLLGQTLDLMRGGGESELNRYISTRWKALGEPDMLKLSLGGKTMLCIRNIECVRNVIMSKTAPFPRSRSARDFMAPMVGNGASDKYLMTELHVSSYAKAIRRAYNQGLQSSNLKVALPKLHAVMEKMMQTIDKQRQFGPINFQELCVRTTLDAIGVIAFATELGGLDNSRDLYKHQLEAGYVSIQRYYMPLKEILYKLLPFLKKAREEKRILEALLYEEWDSLTNEILRREDPPQGEQPMWHILRSTNDPETGCPLEYKSLRSEVAFVVLGGTDTTGDQLAFILALLASYPHVTVKLIEELKDHGLYGPDSRLVTLEDLAELRYLSSVIKEGMRCSHVVPVMFDREAPEDTEILGYRIPKGTCLCVVGNRWFNSESEWGDPYVFRPERWLTGEDVSQKYYFPFLCGPRDCVGQKLAMLEMRVVVVCLIQKYDLVPTCPAEDLLKNSQNGFGIQSVDGIWLHANPRE